MAQLALYKKIILLFALGMNLSACASTKPLTPDLAREYLRVSGTARAGKAVKIDVDVRPNKKCSFKNASIVIDVNIQGIAEYQHNRAGYYSTYTIKISDNGYGYYGESVSYSDFSNTALFDGIESITSFTYSIYYASGEITC